VSSAPHLTVVGPEAREVAVSFVRFPKVHPASVYGHVEVRVWFDGDAAEQALGVDGYPLTFDRLAEARAEVEEWAARHGHALVSVNSRARAATGEEVRDALCGRDRGRGWLFLSLGGFALLAAFGTKAPLYSILYRWMPGFQTFHTPGRFMVLYLLSASALAAMGTEVLLKGVTRRQLLVVAGTAIPLLAPLYYTMSRMYGPDAFAELVTNLLQQSDGPFLWSGLARHQQYCGGVGRLPGAAQARLLCDGDPAGVRSLPCPTSRWGVLLETRRYPPAVDPGRPFEG
jgi:hypothetical protein